MYKKFIHARGWVIMKIDMPCKMCNNPILDYDREGLTIYFEFSYVEAKCPKCERDYGFFLVGEEAIQKVDKLIRKRKRKVH